MRTISIAIVLGLAVALVAPSFALAQGIPPDNSGADQYVEGVPGAGGDKPSGGGGGGGAGNGVEGEDGSGLSPAAQEALEAEGPAGAQVAEAVGATAPGKGGKGADGAKAQDSADSVQRGEDNDGGSGIDDVVGSLTGSDSGGMGLALPAILLLTLLGALALAIVRRRRTPDETS